MTQGWTVAAGAGGTPTVAGPSAGAWLLGSAGATSGRQAEVVAPPEVLQRRCRAATTGVPAVEVRADLGRGAHGRAAPS